MDKKPQDAVVWPLVVTKTPEDEESTMTMRLALIGDNERFELRSGSGDEWTVHCEGDLEEVTESARACTY